MCVCMYAALPWGAVCRQNAVASRALPLRPGRRWPLGLRRRRLLLLTTTHAHEPAARLSRLAACSSLGLKHVLAVTRGTAQLAAPHDRDEHEQCDGLWDTEGQLN
jgi:hypothetical protein